MSKYLWEELIFNYMLLTKTMDDLGRYVYIWIESHTMFIWMENGLNITLYWTEYLAFTGKYAPEVSSEPKRGAEENHSSGAAGEHFTHVHFELSEPRFES